MHSITCTPHSDNHWSDLSNYSLVLSSLYFYTNGTNIYAFLHLAHFIQHTVLRHSLMLQQWINYFPSAQWVKTTKIYYLIVSASQEFRLGFSRCLWFKIFHKATIKLSAVAAIILWKKCAENPHPSSLTRLLAGLRSMLCTGWKYQFFAM